MRPTIRFDQLTEAANHLIAEKSWLMIHQTHLFLAKECFKCHEHAFLLCYKNEYNNTNDPPSSLNADLIQENPVSTEIISILGKSNDEYRTHTVLLQNEDPTLIQWAIVNRGNSSFHSIMQININLALVRSSYINIIPVC
eukprot:scaffold4891_cov28-Attheya_sp.AAC.1